MSSPTNLEINGNLAAHPLAELLVEIMDTKIDGSFRLAHGDQKTIIYIREGEVVYAVSNQRRHRIFELLLAGGALTRQQLVEIPDFTNDLVLLRALAEKRLLPARDINSLATRQIEEIIKSAIEWKDGDWSFTVLARIKEEVCRQIDLYTILIEWARTLPKDAIIGRYSSFKELFGKKPAPPAQINLRPPEAFFLSRFDQTLLRVEQLRDMSGLPEADAMQALYILWLGGFLSRQSWNSAFTPAQISKILSARIGLKKQDPASSPATAAPHAAPAAPSGAAQTPDQAEAKTAGAGKDEITLEKYLAQVDRAETHYELLNLPMTASADDIKRAYFKLARRFHPDLFHKQTDAETHASIQSAFTQIARAYETLRAEDTRQTYDFKLRKLLDELEKLGSTSAGASVEEPKNLTTADEIFEHGLKLFDNEQYEEALPYFVRVVHTAPQVARYHAFYGKALSIDRKDRFKAEAELQTAVKLEPQTPEYRLMLAQFFIQNNLFKRAEGELNRLLAISPNHAEAAALLDSLPNK